MAGKNEISGIMGQHEAIRAQLRFLVDSLRALSLECSDTTTQFGRLQELASNSRLRLYDFRDGIENHIELDERFFEGIGDQTLVEDLLREHRECRNRVADAIRLAESLFGSEVSPETLASLSSEIRIAAEKASRSIVSHMDHEDMVLREGRAQRSSPATPIA